jgi:hypothetical protein
MLLAVPVLCSRDVPVRRNNPVRSVAPGSACGGNARALLMR